MDEGRKRVILIAAAILAARKLRQLESTRPSPALHSIIADAVIFADLQNNQLARSIVRKGATESHIHMLIGRFRPRSVICVRDEVHLAFGTAFGQVCERIVDSEQSE